MCLCAHVHVLHRIYSAMLTSGLYFFGHGHPHKFYSFCNKMEGNPFVTPALNHLGECPICTIPFGFDPDKESDDMIIHAILCCSKFVCGTCMESHSFSCAESRVLCTCPFCRESFTYDVDERNELEPHLLAKLAAKEEKDIVLLNGLSSLYAMWGNKKKALKYCKIAAELGDTHALYEASKALREGTLIERNIDKANRYTKLAANGNHPLARLRVAALDLEDKNYGSAICNIELAAAQGATNATKILKQIYESGMIGKERLERVFRAHYASRKEIENREEERKNIQEQQQKNGAMLVQYNGVNYFGKVTGGTN